jgi:hypothetical protein
MKNTNDEPFYERRKFLSAVTRLAATSVVMGVPHVSISESLWQTYTVQAVIDIILKEIPGAPFSNTVDQLRTGNGEQEVTGIVTTMFPTIQVIEQTARAGANMIIAHETPFYNHQDEID